MKSKVLSLVLAITLLCSIMVPTAAFAATGKTEMVFGTTNFGTYTGSNPTTITSPAPGFAGKASTDEVHRIEVTSSISAVTKDTMARFIIGSGLDITKQYSTFQFNLYFDGKVMPTLFWDTIQVFQVASTGKIFYNAAGTLTSSNTILHAGYWHTAAVTYDSTNNKFFLYVDGEEVVADGFTPATTPAKVFMHIGAYSYSNSGNLAIDDVYAFEGMYDPAEDSVTLVNADDKLTVDSSAKTITCNAADFATVADFNAAVSTAFNAKSATLYADTTFATPSTDLTSGVVVINSSNGVGYEYYTVTLENSSDPDPEPDVTVSEIEIDHDGDNFKRSATVTLTEEYVGCKLFIAFYDVNNELIGVASKLIEEAGENIVTRDQSTVLNTTAEGVDETEYGLTRSLAAFVWTADNQPTGIIHTINREN